MKISEIFESIQGEGKFTGTPMLFIRLSGCNRNCSFCDTKYHKEYKEKSVEELIEIINNSNQEIICWTGGEPLLQIRKIKKIKRKTKKSFHLETNGDFLKKEYWSIFDQITCSPKDKVIAKKIKHFADEIKIVTDLEKVGVDLIKYADSLMPLTGQKNDKEVMKKVWKYCVKNNINFNARIHYLIFGNKKKI